MDNYKGFALFSDIEDKELRNMNRAKVMGNIAEDNIKEKRINQKGASLVLGYWSKLPKEDSEDVLEKFKTNMNQRGFAIV